MQPGEAKPSNAAGRPTNRDGRKPSLDYRCSAVSTMTAATVNLLPRYSSIGANDWDAAVTQDEPHGASTSGPLLPRYSAIHTELLPSPTESSSLNSGIEANGQSYDFLYAYPIRPTKPWAILSLYVRDAVPGNLRPLQAQPKVPRIWGCEPISGRLDLCLDTPLSMQQINIKVTGRITASSLNEGSHKFLNHEFNLWKASDSDSRSHSPIRARFEGKLNGTQSFPFCIPFPNGLDPSLDNISSPVTLSRKLGRSGLNSRRSKKRSISSPIGPISHPAPPSVASSLPEAFMEKEVSTTVNYQLSVKLVHGRFKPDSKITTNIYYIPASQPHPSSEKRRQAYEAGALIPGPISDPDGWFDLPNIPVDGIFTRSRRCKIDCRLYVAQPLSYTRGTVIPCFLTLSSNDAEALHTLSNPDIPNIKLIRRLRHFAMPEDQPHEQTLGFSGGYFIHPLVPALTHSDKSPPHKTVDHEVAMATWWVPPKDVPQETRVRHLEGEIHIHSSLPSSCSSQAFQVDYFVQMFSLQSADFEPIRSASNSFDKEAFAPELEVIVSLPVEITTLCRLDEPLPTPFTEPSGTPMRQAFPSNADAEEEAVSRYLVSGFL